MSSLSSFKNGNNNNVAGIIRTTKPSVSVSAKLTFPCHQCQFEAQSQRQLSRHKAVTHTQNALKCVLCPFVTAYQTNLLRHRKDVHGICGSKGNKSCKFCGFVSEDNDTLIQHQIDFHRDILKSAQVKFAKELVSAGGEETMADFSANFESMTNELLSNRQRQNGSRGGMTQRQPSQPQPPQQPPTSLSVPARGRFKLKTPSQNHNHRRNTYVHHANHGQSLAGDSIKAGDDDDEDPDDDQDEEDDQAAEFEEYWKAGFIDQYGDHAGYFGQNENGSLQDYSSPSSTPKSMSSSLDNNINGGGSILADGNLPATRVKRQYKCAECDYQTTNPREFLYHRRDMHGCKVKIVECPYCVYACQYGQKMQRHLLLVHKFVSGSSSPSGDGSYIETGETNMVPKLKRKRTRLEELMFDQENIDDIPEMDDEQAIENDEKEHSVQVDYDQPINFEMNLNEFAGNDDSANVSEMDSSSNNENGPDDMKSKFPFDLECFICKVKLSDAPSAQRHFLRHHKNADYKSFMSLFKPNSDLSPQQADAAGMVGTTNHKKLLDGNVKNIHVCNLCGFKTRWISELERHVRVHSKDKPFHCPFCNFRSKWKGDLNRHLQRYHSVDNPLPDVDSSDNSVIGGSGSNNPTSIMNSDVRVGDSFGPDDEDFEPYEADLNSNPDMNQIDNDKPQQATTYQCSNCSFTCNTASRFHVHYMQHMNTKPFQCSVCSHRSNWEWDVNKHIKMKTQRDPGHANAYPVLIHPSGKRNYSKYDRFLVRVGPDETDAAADSNNNNSKPLGLRAKRFKNCEKEPEPRQTGNLFTPEVCFEVNGEMAVAAASANHQSKVGEIKSVIASRHPDSRSKMVQCSECPFKHHLARVMVAHMSSHSGTNRAYSCKHCMFETNWREMIITHCKNMHGLQTFSDFDVGFRLAINQDGFCRRIAKEEIAQIEKQRTMNEKNETAVRPTTSINENLNHDDNNSSLTFEPNHYEQEKAVIHCKMCPFFTTNKKKMSIHCRFHCSTRGTLKCKFCPYYVNSQEKLVRHQQLHQKSDQNQTILAANNNHLEDDDDDADDDENESQQRQLEQPLKTLISCSVCPFRTSKVQKYNEHMKNTHQGESDEPEFEMIDDNILEPAEEDYDPAAMMTIMMEADDDEEEGEVMEGEDEDEDDCEFEEQQNGLLVADDYEVTSTAAAASFQAKINRMKNGPNKKFSYVCPECPAAFKSPGDYKIHAVFHSSNFQHCCLYCSYKARNKPQLCKHLYVHTVEYIAKRANSYSKSAKNRIESQNVILNSVRDRVSPAPPSSSAEMALASVKKLLMKQTKSSKAAVETPVSRSRGKNDSAMKPVKEFSETKEYLERIGSGAKSRCVYRCSKCPAVFTKVNTLIYHITLHDQNGRFKCDSCTYSTEVQDNLKMHSLLHNLSEDQTEIGQNYPYNCHLCPAGFSKKCRLEKHLSFHGADYIYKCDNCTYSVGYAATMVKHRALHLINPDFQVADMNSVPEMIMKVGSAATTRGRENYTQPKEPDVENEEQSQTVMAVGEEDPDDLDEDDSRSLFDNPPETTLMIQEEN